MENRKETFEYTYSAGRQEEIENIRKKYLPKQEDKMELLRKMDRETTRLGTIVSIVLGVVGCLLLGIGMSCVMVWGGKLLFVLGVIVGIIGIVCIGMGYPVYHKITKMQREKMAPQILALAEELSK